LHLLERINIDLLAQNSIVPSAMNLTRFKISGSLPSLKVNFSDAKYKAILRLVDVTIPHFDDDDAQAAPSRPAGPVRLTSGFKMPSGFLHLPGREYNVDDSEETSDMGSTVIAQTGGGQDRAIHQKNFELDFRVEALFASIAKVQGEIEKPLGSLSFNRFSLGFSLAKYDMKVDVKLG
jgi:vacuolar protein sorting-associated protein 13A/C